jgi:hypothetical protein
MNNSPNEESYHLVKSRMQGMSDIFACHSISEPLHAFELMYIDCGTDVHILSTEEFLQQTVQLNSIELYKYKPYLQKH